MANMVYIATSIDGFIADKNRGLDWLTTVEKPEGNDFESRGLRLESIQVY
jgi:hypothetical protein